MAKKMDIDQIAERLVEIKKRKGEIAGEVSELDDEKAELEESYKLVLKKRDIKGVPVGTYFVGMATSKKVYITDEVQLMKSIKKHKWDDQVFEQKINKIQLDKLVKAEAKEGKAVAGTKVEESDYIQIKERKDDDAE